MRWLLFFFLSFMLCYTRSCACVRRRCACVRTLEYVTYQSVWLIDAYTLRTHTHIHTSKYDWNCNALNWRSLEYIHINYILKSWKDRLIPRFISFYTIQTETEWDRKWNPNRRRNAGKFSSKKLTVIRVYTPSLHFFFLSFSLALYAWYVMDILKETINTP